MTINDGFMDECMDCIGGVSVPCPLYAAGRCRFIPHVDEAMITNTVTICMEYVCQGCKRFDYDSECSRAQHVFCAGIALTCGSAHG